MEIKSKRKYRAWYRRVEKGPDLGLGFNVFWLAEHWADAMESQMADGQALEDTAAETHLSVTTSAASDLMHTDLGDLMVRFLADCWKHGSRLKEWYDRYPRALPEPPRPHSQVAHRGLGSVAGYTKVTDARRAEAYEQMQERGL